MRCGSSSGLIGAYRQVAAGAREQRQESAGTAGARELRQERAVGGGGNEETPGRPGVFSATPQ